LRWDFRFAGLHAVNSGVPGLASGGGCLVLLGDAGREPYCGRGPPVQAPSEEARASLDRLAKACISPAAGYPPPKHPGFIVRHVVERIGGAGPWAPASS